MTNADDQRSRKTERLGEVLRRVAARLATQRNSGSAFNGSGQDGDRGAATSTYTLAAAGEPADLGGEEGTVARQCGSAGRVRTGDLLVMSQAGYRCSTAHETRIAGSIEARTAETAKDPTPSHAVSAAPLNR